MAGFNFGFCWFGGSQVLFWSSWFEGQSVCWFFVRVAVMCCPVFTLIIMLLFPQLLGVAVFSFMCHHSIPSIVVPLKDKSKVLRVTAVDYLLVLAFSLITALSASLNKPASEICALYTLNFREYPVMALSKFLTLYPVFTLSSNFPLICITLRNNLLSVFPVKVGWIAVIEAVKANCPGGWGYSHI